MVDARLTSRLRRRLAPISRPVAQRDPFRFGRAARAPYRPRLPLRQNSQPSLTPSEPSASPVRIGTEFVLLGIAESQVDGRAVRTAIIGVGEDDVWLVQAGHTQRVLDREYRVDRVTEDSAELVEVSTSSLHRLQFR